MGHVKRFILEKNFNQLLEEISRIVDNELYVGQIIIGSSEDLYILASVLTRTQFSSLSNDQEFYPGTKSPALTGNLSLN